MPTYQYACTECGHRFEQVQAFSEASLTECPNCGGKLRKVYGSVGVVFKGSGFYRTDSRSGAVPAVSSEKSDSSSSESKPAAKESSPKKTSDAGSSSGSSTAGSSSSSSSGSSSSSSKPAAAATT
ncbi:putative regulatory protein, FmdB family [Nakamurella panacisegetis]|uniref:Putative regulatory protein, FmdB family n=1 Tax=Nakamurella panacisegetis TaxID=1090615 RepID=A0A1H0IV09_9ACTN|nr:FmdB family zinc ribbon protein [Nakamurella panacisegetis]SDO35336.1 putative regulatory protein, FmdB family [Nakamurella panacisegetis]